MKDKLNMRIVSTDSQENMLFSPDIIDLPQPDDWGDFIRAIWFVSADRLDKIIPICPLVNPAWELLYFSHWLNQPA